MSDFQGDFQRARVSVSDEAKALGEAKVSEETQGFEANVL